MKQTIRRKLYTIDELISALKLIRFIEYKTIINIGKIADTDLLKVAKQASKTIVD